MVRGWNPTKRTGSKELFDMFQVRRDNVLKPAQNPQSQLLFIDFHLKGPGHRTFGKQDLGDDLLFESSDPKVPKVSWSLLSPNERKKYPAR